MEHNQREKDKQKSTTGELNATRALNPDFKKTKSVNAKRRVLSIAAISINTELASQR